MELTRLNYLNFGDSLEAFQTLELWQSGFCLKRNLIEDLRTAGNPSPFLIEVLRSYGGGRTKRIDLQALHQDILASFKFRQQFSELGSRGFSYTLQESIELCGDQLRDDINLRLALMPDETLFYPPRIKRYLRRGYSNHYRANGFSSIAFALGKITDKACYVLIMQSDLAFRSPAYIRDHFRGWRKVFFGIITNIANCRCGTIYLPFAHDVMKCCHPGFRRPTTTPKSWCMIYDRTAEDFRLTPVRLRKPINIQVYRELDSVLVRDFFKLDLGH